MQTLIAWSHEPGRSAPIAESRLARVEAWYGSLWGPDWKRYAAHAPASGLAVWTRAVDACRWPAWQQDESSVVATLNVPLGFEGLLGRVGPGTAAMGLVEHLTSRPEDVFALAPPFVLVRLNTDNGHLDLFTDAFGIGRLYYLESRGLHVWSNRPLATLLFAGERAMADLLAWDQMAACDWPMGLATPYSGVSAVQAAAHVKAVGGRVDSTASDGLAKLLAVEFGSALTPEVVSKTAEELVRTVRSVGQTWPDKPRISLSGGRDSRVVAAAFIAAGVEIEFLTFDDVPGEAQTASRLTELVGKQRIHTIRPRPRADGRESSGPVDRADRWHDVSEALRPAHRLGSNPPRHMPWARSPAVTGVGGDIAHGILHPPDVERIQRLPEGRRRSEYTQHLLAQSVLPHGIASQAQDAAGVRVEEVVAEAFARGATDARAVSWFYLHEKLRRWGLSGEGFGKVTPLLGPAFVGAAFSQTPQQLRENALYRAVISQLVPEWDEVPFFNATLRQRQRAVRTWLWDESGSEAVGTVVASSHLWDHAFDVPVVRGVWQRVQTSGGGARDEHLLQRVVWRAAFDMHLARANGESPPRWSGADTGVAQVARRDRLRLVRAVATLANDQPLARRLARTKLGRRLRRTLGV